MQVLRDTRALVFQRALFFDTLQTEMKLSFLGNVDGDNDGCGCGDNGEGDEPPCLPKMTRDDQAKSRLAIAPNAIAVASGDVKTIIASRKIAIKGAAPRSRFHPVGVEAFKTITETNQLRRVEA